MERFEEQAKAEEKTAHHLSPWGEEFPVISRAGLEAKFGSKHNCEIKFDAPYATVICRENSSPSGFRREAEYYVYVKNAHQHEK